MFNRLTRGIARHILRMDSFELILTAIHYSRTLKGTFFELLEKDGKVRMALEFDRAPDGGLDMGWGFPSLMGDDGRRIICVNCIYSAPLQWVELGDGREVLSGNINFICLHSWAPCCKCPYFEPKEDTEDVR